MKLITTLLFISLCALSVWAEEKKEQPAPLATTQGAEITEWKEHWGTTEQKTNVTYHDQYRITQTDGGAVKVQILNRNQETYNEQLKGKVLTFTQRTDTLVVQYSLTLQEDGKWMIGTAKTPNKIVPVKWERTK